MGRSVPPGWRLEGERLYLREVRLSDVDGPYVHWMNAPEVMQFLESRFASHSREELQEYVTRVLDDPAYVFLAIVLTEGDRHIGNIKLGPMNQVHQSADVGVLIGEKDCWGKGYATEAIRLVSQYAFHDLGLYRLTAGCYAPNQGSARAFQKAGFVIEGVRKNHYVYGGMRVDEILMALTRQQP